MNFGHSSLLLLSEVLVSLELREKVFLFWFLDFLRIFFTWAYTKALNSFEELEQNSYGRQTYYYP